MAFAPQFATHRFGSASARHTLELYLDLICPFSAKLFKGVQQHLLPTAVHHGVQIIIRQTPQPWHPSSTLVHEAALAVSHATRRQYNTLMDDPRVVETFQEYFALLMDRQAEFYDEPTADESPNQTRERLADLAETMGVDKDLFLEILKVGKGNSGNAVTNDLKLQIRMGRQTSIHVTPTAVLDGLIDASVSSSFTAEDWAAYVKEKIDV